MQFVEVYLLFLNPHKLPDISNYSTSGSNITVIIQSIRLVIMQNLS